MEIGSEWTEYVDLDGGDFGLEGVLDGLEDFGVGRALGLVGVLDGVG